MGLVRLFPPLSRQPSLATRGVKEPEYEVAELDGWPTGYSPVLILSKKVEYHYRRLSRCWARIVFQSKHTV